MLILRYLLKGVILPPMLQLLLIGSAWLVRRRYPRLSRWLLCAGVGSLLLLSTPLVVMPLVNWNESIPPLDLKAAETADVIVVLSAGAYYDPLEFDRDQAGENTLIRLRYAAWLHRRLGTPILVTGGRFSEASNSLADIMAYTLKDHMNVPVQWVERKSRTTWENARFTQQLLAAEGGIDRRDAKPRILLVTHASHMRRSLLAFEQVGFEVLPAATQYRYRDQNIEFEDLGYLLLPSAKALQHARDVMHEGLGRLIYRLLYW